MAGWGTFEFGEWVGLKDSLKAMKLEFAHFEEECIREIAGRLLAKVIARTPVDTGELRHGWTIGQIARTANGYEVEIINPVEHAMYVEYGHRTRDHTGWVNGRFMLTYSIQEMERELPDIIERKLQQFIDRHMG
ncbi:hypothetical protein Back11_11700 [Paenibacillus baekrokdamisoli]|uniref:Uncharacterized protein n=1 Tax=Paenibacillus baekrokdamisoli TaxID=1712516 RepID=A0A3G9IUT6_9BACL|nr:HK97 gp10 family phage protein [Paenibacillus baekrokdamisoli]MBB3070475.1 hypothetical protein [Paenibacillus baekrokdamisoli]BBH19825.1 hypothetical protein Back11_11700 [Paenibacillus baekrokdamisoli]